MIRSTIEEYNELLEKMKTSRYLYVPIYRDRLYHPLENKLLCVGIVFRNGETHTISISHDDVINEFDPSEFLAIYKNGMSYDYLNALLYVTGQPSVKIVDFYTRYILGTYSRFNTTFEANRFVPLSTWDSVIRKYGAAYWTALNKPLPPEYKESFGIVMREVKTLRRIEQAGMMVDVQMLMDCFSRDAASKMYFGGPVLYTTYNPFTTLGRPSNTHGGLNFSALSKSSGIRNCFISRYPKGKLVLLDFEAYHVRVAADLLGVELPKGKSIHTEFAKQYFNTNDITEDMRLESKKMTFEAMYGQNKDTYGIELFEKIQSAKLKLDESETIELGNKRVIKIGKGNGNKAFNYHMQSLELPSSMGKLNKVMDLLENINGHLTLYVYDSILLDIESIEASENVIREVIDVLEENGKFPIRMYVGDNYGDMKLIKSVDS